MGTRHPLKLALLAGTLSVAGCGSAEPGGSSTGAAGSGGAQSTGGTGQAGGTTGGSSGAAPAGAGGAGGSGGAIAGAGGGAAGEAGAGARGGGGGDGPGGATGGSVGAAGAGGTDRWRGVRWRRRAERADDGGGGGGSTGSGTCTASKAVNTNATGSGPHRVVVETNADPGIKEGTIFRPMDLGGAEKYPIFVWGEGACSQNGLSNATAMAEIASHGYFVVADGTPNGTGNRTQDRSNAESDGRAADRVRRLGDRRERQAVQRLLPEPRHDEDRRQRILVRRIDVASHGRAIRASSPGASTAAAWPARTRISTTWSSTPVLFVEGGPDDIAYDGGSWRATRPSPS